MLCLCKYYVYVKATMSILQLTRWDELRHPVINFKDFTCACADSAAAVESCSDDYTGSVFHVPLHFFIFWLKF